MAGHSHHDDPDYIERLRRAQREAWIRRRAKYGPGGRRDCPGKAEMRRREAAAFSSTAPGAAKKEGG